VTIRTSTGPWERPAGPCALSHFERLAHGTGATRNILLIRRSDCQVPSRHTPASRLLELANPQPACCSVRVYLIRQQSRPSNPMTLTGDARQATLRVEADGLGRFEPDGPVARWVLQVPFDPANRFPASVCRCLHPSNSACRTGWARGLVSRPVGWQYVARRAPSARTRGAGAQSRPASVDTAAKSPIAVLAGRVETARTYSARVPRTRVSFRHNSGVLQPTRASRGRSPDRPLAGKAF
jgi:hypothetical protein